MSQCFGTATTWETFAVSPYMQLYNANHEIFFDVVTDGEAGIPSEIQTVMWTIEGKDCIAIAAYFCSTILAFSYHVTIL
jgi:hypothetical protein